VQIIKFDLIWRILIFLFILVLTATIVRFFFSEQTKSLQTSSKGKYGKVLEDLQRIATEGSYKGDDKPFGKVDPDVLSSQLGELKKRELGSNDLHVELSAKISEIKLLGGSFSLINANEIAMDNARKIGMITSTASILSAGIYILIYVVGIYAFIFITFISHLKSKTIDDELLSEFSRAMNAVSLVPSIDPVRYYRERASEISQSRRDDKSSFISYLSNLGLLGTLFGLAVAFYTAASSFPAELKEVFGSNESQIIVVGGLIQTIYNYSFAVITSLVAYSMAMCLRLIIGADRTGIVKLFDEMAAKKMNELDTSSGATEMAIVEYVRQIVKGTDIEGRLKGALSDILIFVDATSKTIKSEILELKETIINTKTDHTNLIIRMKGAEIILEQLAESSKILNDKLDRVVNELNK